MLRMTSRTTQGVVERVKEDDTDIAKTQKTEEIESEAILTKGNVRL